MSLDFNENFPAGEEPAGFLEWDSAFLPIEFLTISFFAAIFSVFHCFINLPMGFDLPRFGLFKYSGNRCFVRFTSASECEHVPQNPASTFR